MTGHNVLHAMGFDAFGLPAEQYAVQTGTHPRTTTEANIARYRDAAAPAGPGPRRPPLGRDHGRRLLPLDPVDLPEDLRLVLRRGAAPRAARRGAGGRVRRRAPAPTPDGRPWAELDVPARRALIDSHRLAYVSEAPVNWCPGLGTVLANEEVTADGRSERGNFPVFRRNLKQWVMRITAYADRLAADLDRLDWPDSVKAMQRNWIGRSEGARVTFPVVGAAPAPASRSSPPARTPCSAPPTWCWRPSTRWSSTSSPAPGRSTPTPAGPAGAPTPAEAVAAYRDAAARKSDLDRQENKDKTGVFTGAVAVNPANGQAIPVFVADYVLMGYGTGAIMAVPGQDQRDWDFATAFGLPIVRTVAPPAGWDGRGVHRRRAGDQLAQRRGQPGRAGRRRGQARDHRLAGRARAPGRRPCSTSCATGCSPGSATGASRSRSSGTSTAPCRCPTTSCPSRCPTSRTTRRRPTPRTPRTPSPSRRCRAPRTG